MADAVEYVADGVGHQLVVFEQEFFEMPFQHRQGIFEVRPRLAPVGVGFGALRLALAGVGEKTRQGDQHEMRLQFLFDAAFGLAVKLLHAQQQLAALVRFLNSPSVLARFRQGLEVIATAVQQGGRQGVGGAAMGVFHSPLRIAWKLRLTFALAAAEHL